MVHRLIMANRKVVVIDEEMDKILGNVCDAALKGSGMQIVASVNAVIEAVSEEQDSMIE
jgi:hypothetical protein